MKTNLILIGILISLVFVVGFASASDEKGYLTRTTIDALDYVRVSDNCYWVSTRGDASHDKTLGLCQGGSATYAVKLEKGKKYSFQMRHSNDGPRDFIKVLVNGQKIGTFYTTNTGSGVCLGCGWNIFAYSPKLYFTATSTGTTYITVKGKMVSYGFEMDNFVLVKQ